MKAAHRVLGGNVGGAPCRRSFGAGDADQGQAHAVGIGEGQHGPPEAFFRRLGVYAVLDQPVRPIGDCAFGHAKCRLLRQADAATPRRRMLPRKEREDGAGMADPVAIIEMIGAGIVEVHRLLDEAQPDDASIEIPITLGLAGNRSDVMDARHGSVLRERGNEGHAVILLSEHGNGASPRTMPKKPCPKTKPPISWIRKNWNADPHPARRRRPWRSATGLMGKHRQLCRSDWYSWVEQYIREFAGGAGFGGDEGESLHARGLDHLCGKAASFAFIGGPSFSRTVARAGTHTRCPTK